MCSTLFTSILTLAFFASIASKRNILDDSGYVVYCPCMGRFGNQADQFIGALSFAKGLNRTLVLPPWIIYPRDKPFTSLQIAFDQWFEVEPLTDYHRVITMKDFMYEFAQRVWPPGMRTGFCYTYRNDVKSCPMKEGNPFGPFWDHFGINFDFSAEHRNLFWDTWDKDVAERWNEKFSPRKYPVLAFHGAPGSFPSLERNQFLQQYIYFSQRISKKADDFINKEIGRNKYVGIHLRNGIDMIRVCPDIANDKYESLFSSAQCTGYNKEKRLTVEMCDPPRKEVIRKVKYYIKKIKASALFIATDNDPLISHFKKELPRNIKIITWKPQSEVDDAIIDLALLSKSDFFIGNCVSSFSAFVRRQRESRNEDFDFFSSDDAYSNKNSHDEL